MKTIDTHTHFYPQEWIDLLARDGGTKVRPELKHMKRLPSEYLRRFTYDTKVSQADRDLILGKTAA